MSLRRLKPSMTLAGAVVLVLGGGRLALNEVRLAGEAAQRQGLELKAAEADKDRRQLIALELQLADATTRSRGLAADLSREQSNVAALSSRLDAARQAMASAEQEAVATRNALRTRLERQRATLQEELDQASAAVAAREAALARERERGAELRAARDEALARATANADQRDAARAAAETERKERLLRETLLADALGQLSDATAQAAERKRALDAVEAAGVNVARLTGERPLPQISAVIVHIDAEASPLEVLVDAGRGSGLELGDRLYVLRDGRHVACLEVFAVHEEVSATRLVTGERRLQLRAGEDVTSVDAKSP